MTTQTALRVVETILPRTFRFRSRCLHPECAGPIASTAQSLEEARRGAQAHADQCGHTVQIEEYDV